MLTVSSAKLTGNPAAAGWAQVYDFKPQDEEKLKKRGHLFAVIATDKQNGDIDKVVTGRELLTRLHEEYFGKEEGTSFNVLKSALEKVIQEFNQDWGNIEIAAIAQLDKVIYSAVGGGAQIGILRKGMFAKILVSKEGQVVSASGYPEENDFLVLGTKNFFEGLTDAVIIEALGIGDPNQAVEVLTPSLHTKLEQGNIGASILKFFQKQDFFKKTEKVEGKRKLHLPTQKFSERLSKISQSLQVFAVKRLPKRRIVVKKGLEEEMPEKKKNTLSVGAILLILLVVSIVFGLRQKTVRDKKNQYEGKLTEAIHKFEEAKNLFEIEPSKARDLFRQSEEIVIDLRNQEIKDSEIEKLWQNIQEERGGILAEYKPELNLFIDLSLLSSGLSGEKLAYSLGNLYVLDTNSKKVVEISVDTKKTEVVAGPDVVGEVDDLAAYEERVYVIGSSGVSRVDEDKEELIEKDWQGEIFSRAYAGNFYIISKDENTIYRYAGIEDGFGEQTKWLAPGIEVDFSLLNSVAIDGSVWVTTSSGKILKLVRGSPENVSIKGTYPELVNIDIFYTNEELDSFYIFDRNLNRIVVFDKEGNYKAQYQSDALSEAKDFVVSEEEKKIIVLTGEKIYSIDLSHL